MCRNPLVAEDRRRTRKELLEATSREPEKIRRSIDAGRLVKAEEHVDFTVDCPGVGGRCPHHQVCGKAFVAPNLHLRPVFLQGKTGPT
ncbi:MAG TPA: hypothetical protein GX513_07470 [Firmicutes bacterium]|nr:hypothetical protein [Bacillota bacterium]